jgi:hypothetical protein
MLLNRSFHLKRDLLTSHLSLTAKIQGALEDQVLNIFIDLLSVSAPVRRSSILCYSNEVFDIINSSPWGSAAISVSI